MIRFGYMSKTFITFAFSLFLIVFCSTVCPRASSTPVAYTDLDSLGGEPHRLRERLEAQLTSMSFETLESAIERVKKIRAARTELLGS